MRLLLIYFTGTFNTRYLTERLRARFPDTDVCEIGRDDCPQTDGYDLVGIGYPIHAFNSPAPLNRLLSRLNFRHGQQYFVYKNSGETFAANDDSSRAIKAIMRRKKAVFMGEYHFIMPYNIHFAFDREFVRELLVMNEKLADVLYYRLTNGIVVTQNIKPIYKFVSAAVNIQKLGGAVNSFFYSAKRDKCTLCGKCAHSCPTDNIAIKNGRVRFGHKCVMCMRCSFYCPTDAIRIGFLNGWRVNGDYNLSEAAALAPSAPYITPNARGFYKCFPAAYARINAAYSALPTAYQTVNDSPRE